jgi:hypothetical protein
MAAYSGEQEQHQQKPADSDKGTNPHIDLSGEQNRYSWAEIKKNAKEYWTQFVEHVERRSAFYVALSGIAVAGFTLALFIATFLLWFAGERHSERQLRAYVSTSSGSMRVVNIAQGGQGFQITIELRNAGQTPGYDAN